MEYRPDKCLHSYCFYCKKKKKQEENISGSPGYVTWDFACMCKMLLKKLGLLWKKPNLRHEKYWKTTWIFFNLWNNVFKDVMA